MRELLRKPLPTEAVKPHPTKTYLSSIKAIYVTERLNEVFGVGSWSLKTDHILTTDKGMVVCKTILEIKEYGIYYESFGGSDNGGENSKNFDLGDAYKGATTDAITKICSYMEIGIDVFKGKAGASSAQSSNNTENKPLQPSNQFANDERPWLTDKAFETVKSRMLNGELDVFEKTTQAFRIKKAFHEELQAIKDKAA